MDRHMFSAVRADYRRRESSAFMMLVTFPPDTTIWRGKQRNCEVVLAPTNQRKAQSQEFFSLLCY